MPNKSDASQKYLAFCHRLKIDFTIENIPTLTRYGDSFASEKRFAAFTLRGNCDFRVFLAFGTYYSYFSVHVLRIFSYSFLACFANKTDWRDISHDVLRECQWNNGMRGFSCSSYSSASRKRCASFPSEKHFVSFLSEKRCASFSGSISNEPAENL